MRACRRRRCGVGRGERREDPSIQRVGVRCVRHVCVCATLIPGIPIAISSEEDDDSLHLMIRLPLHVNHRAFTVFA